MILQRISIFFILLLLAGGCSLLPNWLVPKMNSNAPASEEDEPASDATALLKDSSQKKRLPTLREQMQRLDERQEAMQTDIQAMRQDIASLRADMEQVKAGILGKAPLKETGDVKGSAPVAPPDSAQTEPKSPKKDTPKKTLQPDNAAKSEKKDVKKAKEEKPKESKKLAPDPKPAQPVDTVKAKKEKEEPAGEQYKKAMQLISKKQYAEAIRLLNMVLDKEKNPMTRSNAYYWLGESHFATDEFTEAIQDFKEVMKNKTSTKVDDAMILLGECYMKLNNKEEAKKTYEQLIKLYPSSEFIPRAKKMLQVL